MTTDIPTTETGPATPPPAATPPASHVRRPADPVPRRGGGLLAVSILLSLAALGAAGYTAWTVWEMRQDIGAANGLHGQVETLQGTVDGLRDDNAGLRRRLAEADAVNHSAHEDMLGVSERTKHLEDAVANLSERSLGGHDAMMLDETESLLRMARERFALFGDASGALAAYDLADTTLAGVNDRAFVAVRQSLAAERKALADMAPATRDRDLATLADLRTEIPNLPLKGIDARGDDQAQRGFWQRAGDALGSIVTVSHDDGAPLGLADDRISRDMAALDIAHAEAAVLAYDDVGRNGALKRVEATLDARFDPASSAVQAAKASIAALLASQAKGAEPKLGAALDELRNLRSVHALQGGQEQPGATPGSAPDAAPSGTPAGGSMPAPAAPAVDAPKATP